MGAAFIKMSLGNKYQIDMCHGPLLSKIMLVALPLMAANVIQVLFTVVDMVVIGRYAGKEAMAAVGSCGVLITTILSLFVGMSTGANVLVARYIGARNREQTARSVHTAVAIAIYGGIFLAVAGLAVSRPVLVLMKTPAEVLSKASLYMRLYSLSIPFVLLYNFGNSIMRATGDTRRPLFYMIVAGAVKVILNILLVKVLPLEVAGVAIATLVSNAISAILVLRALLGMRGSTRLYWRFIRFYGSNLVDILRFGIPAGVSSAVFALSNLVIQSTINSFGTIVMAGNAAAGNLENIVYMTFLSYYYTVISFVGQNHGAKKYKRLVRSVFYCLGLSVSTAVVLGWLAYLTGPYTLPIYNPDPVVVEQGMLRLHYLVTTYFLCGAMDIAGGALRGLGYSVTPMVVSLLGACAFRILWIMYVMPHSWKISTLLLSYPISWVLVMIVNAVILYFVCRKLFREAAHPKRRHGYLPLSTGK